MSYPLHSPVQPWNMVQQLQLVPGCNLTLGIPVTDKQGTAYAKTDVAAMWFGLTDQAGRSLAQAYLDHGITIDDSDPASAPLAIIDILYSDTRSIPTGGHRFMVAMQIGQRVMPMAGGVINVVPSPIVWP